jgi:hypothetical protein
MVRGAYMIQERKRAEQLGYKVNGKVLANRKSMTFVAFQDPICANKEDTDRQYNQLIETLMRAQTTQRVSFMIASHNAQSVCAFSCPRLFIKSSSVLNDVFAGAACNRRHASFRSSLGFKQHRFWAGMRKRNNQLFCMKDL